MPLSVFGHSGDSATPHAGAVRATYTGSAIDPSGGGVGGVASSRRECGGVSIARRSGARNSGVYGGRLSVTLWGSELLRVECF